MIACEGVQGSGAWASLGPARITRHEPYYDHGGSGTFGSLLEAFASLGCRAEERIRSVLGCSAGIRSGRRRRRGARYRPRFAVESGETGEKRLFMRCCSDK